MNKHIGFEASLIPHSESCSIIDFWDGPVSQAYKWEERQVQKNIVQKYRFEKIAKGSFYFSSI